VEIVPGGRVAVVGGGIGIGGSLEDGEMIGGSVDVGGIGTGGGLGGGGRVDREVDWRLVASAHSLQTVRSKSFCLLSNFTVKLFQT
jgi:hypothetical protein